MGCAVKLPNIHDVVLILENRSLVVVNIEIIRRAENGHHAWKTRGSSFPIHSIACILSFMRPDDGQQIILFQKCTCGRIGEKVWAATNMIMNKKLRGLFLTEFFQGVCPQNIAHESLRWWLPESINLRSSAIASDGFGSRHAHTFEIFQRVQFGTQSSMYAQKLLVHDCCERQGTERIHTSFVYPFGILMLTFELERKVVR